MPAERHDHFDAEGNFIGHTDVTRQSRVDDADRGEILGLARYELEVCRCGYHPSLTEDESNVWTPESRVCPVCKHEAVWHRIEVEHDAHIPHDAPPKTERYMDGRHSWMRMLTPQQANAARPRD